MNIYDMTIELSEEEFAEMISEWVNNNYEPGVADAFRFNTTNEVTLDDKKVYIHLGRKYEKTI